MNRLYTIYQQLSTKKIALAIFLFLLAYMPLHILLSTWIGTSFNVLEAAKIAKDVLLVVGFGLVLIATPLKTMLEIAKTPIFILISVYAALTLLLAGLRPTDQDAEVLAIVYNLRFLLFFLYGWLLTLHFRPDWLLKKAVKVVLAVAVLVMIFGVIQYTLLPDDALTRIGFVRDNGVLPAFFIDDKPDLERVMSTIRDPNSYGSYLIIISALALGFLLKAKDASRQKVFGGVLALSLLNLFLTFSRSAWIGAFLALLVVVVMSLGRGKLMKLSKKLALPALILLVAGSVSVYAARETYLVQNVIFHADESTIEADPNEKRTQFFQESVNEIADNPVGYGPGTAGIVSIRNNEQGTVLNENYYLQIAYEVGVIGLIIFMAILTLTAIYLLRIPDVYVMTLFGAFIGLAFTNLLVHIWSNEAVAYTFWGLAGLLTVRFFDKKFTKSS